MMLHFGTLKWNDVEGSISFSKAFKDSNGILKLDAIKDWIGVLEDEYERVHELEFGHDVTQATPPGSPDVPPARR